MTLDLYGENILEHFKNPVNRGILADADAKSYEVNPLCGDEIEVSVKVNGDHITDAKFSGTGCAISQAAVDILLQHAKGKAVKDIVALDKNEFLKTLGVQLSALRLKCALLGLKALKLSVLEVISKSVEQ